MNKGFTLLELLVVLAIFIIITSIVLANYPLFKDGISLKKTAQQIAIAIHEAEVYAMAVKSFNDQFSGYGAHFESGSSSFVLFSDIDDDNVYDAGTEEVKIYAIQTNDKIYDLCGNQNSPAPDVCGLASVDIIFLRPNPIVILNGAGSPGLSDIEIYLKSPREKIKKIIVFASGQVSIE